MLDFRQGHRRHDREAAAERQRLVFLVLALGMVMVVIGWARDPGVWRGLDRLMGGGTKPSAGEIRPAAAEHKDLPPDTFLMPKDADIKPRPAAAADANPPAAAASTPRQLFRDLDVGDRYFDRLRDGGPIRPAEVETLLRVMYRLRMFPKSALDHWAADAGKLDEALARPEASRGSIFPLRGTVTAVEPYKPPADAAQRFEMAGYFGCRLQLDSPEQTVEVYTEHVPKAWQKGAQPMRGAARRACS